MAPTTPWTAFERATLRCRACGLHRTSNVYMLAGEGDEHARLALLGEAPGADEELYGQNFVGRAGEMLDGCLQEAGLFRSELWIGNSARCRPITAFGRNRKPSMHEIDCCRQFSVDEFRAVAPRVIVALGETALCALVGKALGGITEHRGKVQWSDEWNAYVVPTFHPAYALRNYDKRQWIVEDLRLAKRVLENGGPAPHAQTTVETVTDLDALEAMRADVLAADDIMFDWETNGVHLTQSRGLCVAFTVREGHAWVVPLFASGFLPCWTHAEYRRVCDVLREILSSEIPKGGWHVAFDMSISQSTLGVLPVNVTWCGMVAHHLLYADLGEVSLKDAAQLYTPMGRYDDPLDQWLVDHAYTAKGKPDHGKIWLAPDTLVRYYAGCDSDATWRTKAVLYPRVVAAGLLDIFTNERMPLVRAHQEIDRTGVRIDVPYLNQLSEQLGAALTRLRQEIADVVGPDIIAKFKNSVINPESNKQVAKLLYDEIGFPILARTEKGGEPSTKKDVLIQIRDAHPVIPLILAHRAHSKIKGTYVDGTNSEAGKKKALRAVLDEDGYARMDTHLARLVTFRLATTKPFAVHTFPKTDPRKGLPSVRALIIPDDGHLLISRDYRQVEFVIQSIAAGQWDMVTAILDHGEDVHDLVARELGGVHKQDYLGGDFEHDGLLWKSKDAYDTYTAVRKKWKSVGFLIMFLGQARKLARFALGCTLDVREGAPCKSTGTMACDCEQRAQFYIDEYYERYYEIHVWHYRTIKATRVTGRSVGLFGTYRRLPGIHDRNPQIRAEAERQAVNFPIQDASAHVMIRALLKIVTHFKREKLPARVIVTIHDELIAQAREDVVEDADAIMRSHMEAEYPELAGRSLRTDRTIARCWGG